MSSRRYKVSGVDINQVATIYDYGFNMPEECCTVRGWTNAMLVCEQMNNDYKIYEDIVKKFCTVKK